MSNNSRIIVNPFGFVAFLFLIGCLYIGFLGGEQQLQNIYPNDKEIIHFASEIIRIAFWVIFIILIAAIVMVVGSMIFAAALK